MLFRFVMNIYGNMYKQFSFKYVVDIIRHLLNHSILSKVIIFYEVYNQTLLYFVFGSLFSNDWETQGEERQCSELETFTK